MQTLWVYIDDIIGKGAGILMISEFLFYLSISVFPMALPIAVLISSVMVMGNLAEHYELASMKSAGIPLLRIMRPLIYVCVGVAIFSWFSANYLIPIANLKFKSRLYDMRKQKPTLNLEEGIFNNDFDGYRIRIGEKGKDKQAIKNVLIANHSGTKRDELNELIAEGGRMYTTKDERYLVMELENGEQFQEGNRLIASKNKAPFVRTSFKKYTKIFDMQEFEINRTDEELFRTHYSMLSMQQLQEAIDSIDLQIDDRKTSVGKHLNNYFSVLKKNDSLSLSPTENSPPPDIVPQVPIHVLKDEKTNAKDSVPKEGNQILPTKKKQEIAVKLKTKRRPIVNQALVPSEQIINQPLKNYNSLLETFAGYKRQVFADKALQFSRSIKTNAESAVSYVEKTKEKRVKHVFELHSKYAYAFACIVFLFIGAPMGAIVRKGGFGYPLLIAITFFMLFITFTLTFKRMAEAGVIPALLASWLANLIMLPIGLFLTFKAMNDSKVANLDRIVSILRRLLFFLNG